MAEVVKVSKSTQKKSILNWFLSCAVGGNYEFMHGVGFMYSMVPVVKELYPNDVEKQKETLTRHLTFLNTEPEVGTVIHGVTIAMEEQVAAGADCDADQIVGLKSALMGPLAGIGDSLLFSVVRVIAAGIGISFALQGSILGPILFFLIYNGCTMALRYSLGYIGFISGSSFITKMYEDGTLKVLTKCAGILGLIMVGAMTASTVKFTTAINIAIPGAEAVSLQSSLDTLFLGIVPLLLTFGCKKLLDKNVNINWIMIGILVLSMVMAVLHIV